MSDQSRQDIQIVARPRMTLKGVRGVWRQGRHVNPDVVASLWQQLDALWPGAKQQADDEFRYAVITGDVPGRETATADYFAGYAVSEDLNTPAGLAALSLESGNWLITDHVGPPWTLRRTTEFVFSQWLPDHDQAACDSVELFRFPPGYDRNDPLARMTYGIRLYQ